MLHVAPRPLRLWAIILWVVLIHVLAIGLLIWFNNPAQWDSKRLALLVLIVSLELPNLIGAVVLFNHLHTRKGPVLELDRIARLVRLLRDDEELTFDGVEAVHVLRWWRKHFNEWNKWIELRLRERRDDGAASYRCVLGIECWLAYDPTEKLATQVAEELGVPLEETDASRDSG